MKEHTTPLVIIAGPTAVGKTQLSIALAKAIGGEIISADSMQVYRHMNIGSAKVTKESMQGIPHHLIDILEPTESFDVVLFAKLAKEAITEIRKRNHIPILVGGTGFYIQAVLYDIDFTEQMADVTVREQLNQLATTKGNRYLHEALQRVDEVSAANIHENNVKRVIRALEFNYLTGQKISEHNEIEHKKKSCYAYHYFVITDDRATLYAKINQRVDEMMQEGLLEEVQQMLALGCVHDSVSMQGLGYKQLLNYLAGECTLEEAVCAIKQETRHFAKRQLTWFRRESEAVWIDKRTYQHQDILMIHEMIKQIQEHEHEHQ
ncbi:MAG: tRNA (adenosine(37)-N6)-dimethylallyltransferase MiaA [Lachnospiraceae bacterium]